MFDLPALPGFKDSKFFDRQCSGKSFGGLEGCILPVEK
jgi:hypothetical protein